MKTSKSDIIGLHEVGFQDATKGNSYLLDTSVMLMDCEESETNSLTNKSSVPGSKQLFSLRYNEMYIHLIRWNLFISHFILLTGTNVTIVCHLFLHSS